MSTPSAFAHPSQLVFPRRAGSLPRGNAASHTVTTLTVVTFGSVWLRTRDQPYAPKLNRVVITAIPTRTRRYVIVEPANDDRAQLRRREAPSAAARCSAASFS